MTRWFSTQRILTMAAKPKLNVQSFPRPPRLERTTRHLQIRWQGQVIADTANTVDAAYWVLETHHPPSTPTPHPTYFLMGSIKKLLKTANPSSVLPPAFGRLGAPDPDAAQLLLCVEGPGDVLHGDGARRRRGRG